MRFHQETEVAVFTEIRGQENFRRLAVQLPAGINIRDQGVNHQRTFFRKGGGSRCFTCNSQLLLSRSTPAPCRGQVWSAPSPAPAWFHWLCCWGKATRCSDPWGAGCGKTRWNETRLKRRELPCLGNERGLKREENDQNTRMNSVTNSKWRHVWMISSQ